MLEPSEDWEPPPVVGDVDTEEGQELVKLQVDSTIRTDNGEIITTLPGHEFKSNPTAFPAASVPAIKQALLQAIASGLGVSYAALAGDQTAANFSSLRFGRLDDVGFYADVQDMVVELLYAILRKWASINLPLPDDLSFRAPGFEYIEPTKEATADKIRLADRTITYTEVFARQGKDFEEEIDRMAAEMEYAQSKGVPIYGSSGNTQ